MRKIPSMLTLGALAMFGAGPAIADHHETGHDMSGHDMKGEEVAASVIDTSGEEIGMVRLQQTPAGVLVTAHVMGLEKGEHGFHLHQKGMCDAAQKFTTAGGHFNPGNDQHGLMVEGGPHGGDMPNQYADDSGMIMTQVLNTGVSLDKDAPNSIWDQDGTALVIHAKADDYMSQPSGDAGDRVACAVVAKPM
ncbi:superoxide dismutase family protein [Novosphingobium aquimarinum]|uniref:superoxide dismutase family protein n=1 Tax=Novosphingobium aquimarinum TaxID=2682494 RepID=UPI0012EC59EF|nr:superoxide dismutase family protein [Novosphingobium aquimarinum]